MNMIHKCWGKAIVIASFLLVGFVGLAYGQVDEIPQRGFHPAGSYALTELETVNTIGGDLMYHVPLASLPSGRGGSPGAKVGLFYNSKLYDGLSRMVYDYNAQTYTSLSVLTKSLEGGWHYGLQYQLKLDHRFDHYLGGDGPQCPSSDAIQVFKLKMSFPDGSEREFRPYGYTDFGNDNYFSIRPDGWVQNCTYPTLGSWTYGTVSYYSTDGSFLRLEMQHDDETGAWYNNPWTLYYPDGSRVTGNEPGSAGQRFYDRNNHFTEVRAITYNNHSAHQIIDQLGRDIIIEYGSAANQDTVHVKGYNNQAVDWVIKWTVTYVLKSYYPGIYDPYPDDLDLSHYNVDEITLPSQAGALSYRFGYNGSPTDNYPTHTNGWGELSWIKLPHTTQETIPAQASYQYHNDGQDFLSASNALDNRATQRTLTYKQEYDGSATQATEVTTYNRPCSGCAEVKAPDGGATTEYYTNNGSWDKTLVYKTVRPDGSVVERIWQQNIPFGAISNNAINPYVKTEFTSVKDANGTLSKTAITDYSYDKNGNVTQVAEYDWVPYSSVPRGGSYNAPTGIPSGVTPKRVSVNTYYNPTPNATNSSTDDADVYHKASSPNVKRALESNEVRSGLSAGTVLSRTETFYDNAAATGNVTTQKSWDSAKGAISYPLGAGNSIAINHSYLTWSSGATGKLDSTTDANGNVTKYSYDTAPNDLYPIQTVIAYGTSIARTMTQNYDLYTGVVTQATDADNNITTKTTYDVFGRPTLVEEGGTGTYPNFTYLRQTSTEYEDTLRRVIVRASKDTKIDGLLISVQHYDQLGRVRLTRQLENGIATDATDETKGVKVQTRYFSGDYNGTSTANPNSYALVSNPYRTDYSYNAGSEATMGWTRTKADQGGRNIETQTFGGTTLPQPFGSGTNGTGTVATGYDGERMLVIDQAGKKRISETDGLGRLSTVWEITPSDSSTEGVTFPGTLGTGISAGYKTTYTYDALGNLMTVNQRVGSGGTLQTRTFVYNSLKRLTSANNPESGTTSYTYYNNGNLYTRTDARGVGTTINYDALNRPTSKTYTTSGTTALATPSVYYYYDNQSLPSGAPSYTRGSSIGRLVATTYGSSGTSEGNYFAYDVLGRVTEKWQRTGTQNYRVQATYNLAGTITGETYPSTHTVSYSHDNSGRVTSFSGNLGDGMTRTYATGITYNTANQMTREQYGTGTALFHRIHYNNRLQAYDMRVGTDSSTTLDSDDPNNWQYTAGSWNRGALRLYYAKDSGNNYVVGNGGLSNNGNLLRMDHFAPADDSVTSYAMSVDEYLYDELNRIKSITESTQTPSSGTTPFQQAYTYDRFGNRTIDQANTWVKDGTVWADDALPTGAYTGSEGGDGWTWVTSSPTPYSGSSSHQSNTASGQHQHFFYGATQTLTVNTGDRLYAYVYLDPTNPPTEVMLQWNDGSSWEHRAYWGANSLTWGTDGTNSRRYMGPLPATGRWVRLEVPASSVGLEGQTVSGMAFSLYDGKATWDRAGKTTLESGGINAKAYTASATDSRLQSPTSSIVYDAAGNIISDSYTNPELSTHKYDAENRLGEVYSFASVLKATYVYNSDGQRIKRITTSETWQVYGIGGELIAEYAANTAASSPQKEYGYRGGQLLISAESSGDVKWLVPDHLGTPRMVIDKSGALTDNTGTTTINEGVIRHDYLPFGEELVTGVGIRIASTGYASDTVRQKFGTKERDIESGLDYFGARYFASKQGRFTSPDPMMASGRASNPQSWNRYSYVLNRPLSLIDPSGMVDEDPRIEQDKKAQAPPKPKVEVIIIGGGANSSDAPADQSAQPVKPGGKVKGLGEESLDDYEARNIAQEIANCYPDAKVTLSGPNGINQISNDIVNSKPDNVIIYGFSMGANSAVGLTNVLTNNGVKVDQLTTVDAAPALNSPSIFTAASPTIKNPSMVGDAVNYSYLGSRVGGAQNVPIASMQRRPETNLNHGNADDITSSRVVRRIEGKLFQIFHKPQK